MGTKVEEEPLFSFPRLEPFTDSTFNTPVRDEKQLLNTTTILPLTHPNVEDGNNCLSSSSSEDNSPPPQRSTRIRHEPTRYGLVAEYITFSSVAQNEIRKPLSYNKTI